VVGVFGGERLAGVTEHPNLLGLFAAIGVILWWQDRGAMRAVGVSLCGLALLATDSRTAWFACAGGIFVLVAAHGRYSAGRLLLAGLALICLAWASLHYIAADQGSVVTFTGRTEVWRFVQEHWTEAPILGHGSGVWAALRSASVGAVWEPNQAHNQLLQTLYTTGLVGLGLLALLLWRWTRLNLDAARRGYALPLALEAMVVIDGLFESPLLMVAAIPTIWLLSLLVFLRQPGGLARPEMTTLGIR
jgi:O-antigen ligase